MPSRFTVALCEADPPLPVQVSVKVVVAVRAAEVSVPVVALVPLQPPLAEQLEAFVLLQVKVAVDPDATTLGFAERATVGVGGGGGGGAELPPPPPPQPLSTDERMIAALLPASGEPRTPSLQSSASVESGARRAKSAPHDRNHSTPSVRRFLSLRSRLYL